VTPVLGPQLIVGTSRTADHTPKATDEKQSEENAYGDLDHVSPR
jgi:hypothetical protein